MKMLRLRQRGEKMDIRHWLYKTDLQFGLGDGELPYPQLVVHHAVLGAADKLRAQHPPGQTQVEYSLCGAGPVP